MTPIFDAGNAKSFTRSELANTLNALWLVGPQDDGYRAALTSVAVAMGIAVRLPEPMTGPPVIVDVTYDE